MKSEIELIAVGTVFIVLAFFGGTIVGKMDEQAREAARQARTQLAASNHARAQESAAAEVSDVVATKTEANLNQVRVVTRTLIQKVPVYATSQADARCVVSRGFVRLHDQAAAGDLSSLPDSSSEPDDADSGVTISSVGATVVTNYGTCHEAIDKLSGLQEWAREQSAVYDKQ